MSEHGVLAGVTRPIFVVFALLGLSLIVLSAVALIESPGYQWRIAIIGVLCAAVLEIPRLRVGSVAHRTPVITLPVIGMLALEIVIPLAVAVGVAVFGVLVVELLRTRRVFVSLYRAGLTGAGGLCAALVYIGLEAASVPGMLASASAAVAYVAFVITAETLRMRYATAMYDRGGRGVLSVPRVLIVMIGYAAFAAGIIEWNEMFSTGISGELALFVVFLALSMVVALEKLLIRTAIMRQRLLGMIAGVAALNASTFATSPRRETPSDGASGTEAACDLTEMLCRAVSDTVGVESITVRDRPAQRGEIGVAVSLTAGSVQHLVARRDPMDREFSIDDERALRALAHTADVVARAQTDIDSLIVRANTDPLTELPNYGAFQESLAHVNATRGPDDALAVLFFDLDNFKRLNDRFGHQVGDSVLQQVGRRLRTLVSAGDVVARVGGDEFVVILTGLCTLAEAKARAEVILDGVSQPITVAGLVHSSVLSMGLAYSAHRETNMTALIQDADRSMLAVKRSRRTVGPAHESSLSITGHTVSPLNEIVRRALDENLLQLAFQPIVSLVTHEIWAFEALVRYTDAELGPISPPALVEKARSLGRLDDFTRQVGTKAMLAAEELRLIDPRVVCMTFNVELEQILPDRLGAFFENLAVRHASVSVCLEMNERSVATVSPSARTQIEHLRDLGILIALDDYGSQDSSVDALVRLPMDILKIDRSLVDDLTDVRQREVLTALQGFGDNLEYSMIVEGVENQFMADQLRLIGIRAAQGFHYGVPATLEHTLTRLDRHGVSALLPMPSTALPTAALPALDSAPQS